MTRSSRMDSVVGDVAAEESSHPFETSFQPLTEFVHATDMVGCTLHVHGVPAFQLSSLGHFVVCMFHLFPNDLRSRRGKSSLHNGFSGSVISFSNTSATMVSHRCPVQVFWRSRNSMSSSGVFDDTKLCESCNELRTSFNRHLDILFW